MTRVLVLDEALPYPPDSGKRIRTWELLRRLAPAFEITLLYPDRETPVPGALDAVRGAGIEPLPVPCGSVPRRGPGFAFDLARNLLCALPYSTMVHRPRRLRRALADALEKRCPDLLHVEWAPLLANLPRDVGVPVSVAAHNVETEIWERHAQNEPTRARRAYARLQAWKMGRFERAALSRAAVVLAVSERDAAAMRSWPSPPRVVVVRNGVDTTAFRPDASVPARADETVFVGSLDWRPNQDAASWFLDEVLPRLRARRPAATFTLVGRRPPEWLVARARAVPGVAVEASVPDVRPFVARAAVSVVPLRVGGGSRIKILEALAMGRPVVSTTLGAEGLDVGDGVVLADGADAFAAAVASSLADPAGALARAARGRAAVLAHHDWDAVAPVQADAWRACARAGESSP